jgi:L-glyceraldehyde 3-phosphate reductase
MSFAEDRYEKMTYNRCGQSGLKLPKISLGMWHNFGANADHDTCRAMTRLAFNSGITHFDLANGYGPPMGSAEKRVGQILKEDFSTHRDELIISTKAGWPYWPGPYGDWGSKKHLLASLDRSLKYLDLDYVDIFYHHREDPETPLVETIEALAQIMKQGKALYVGLSNYSPERFIEAHKIAQSMGIPLTIYQPKYNLLNRDIELQQMTRVEELGTGVICYSPIAEGVLTEKYLDKANPVPSDSRAAQDYQGLTINELTEERLVKVRKLLKIAQSRGQSLPQMAVAWTLRNPNMNSALIGARTPKQLANTLEALNNLHFTDEELAKIDTIFPILP